MEFLKILDASLDKLAVADHGSISVDTKLACPCNFGYLFAPIY